MATTCSTSRQSRAIPRCCGSDRSRCCWPAPACGSYSAGGVIRRPQGPSPRKTKQRQSRCSTTVEALILLLEAQPNLAGAILTGFAARLQIPGQFEIDRKAPGRGAGACLDAEPHIVVD